MVLRSIAEKNLPRTGLNLINGIKIKNIFYDENIVGNSPCFYNMLLEKKRSSKADAVIVNRNRSRWMWAFCLFPQERDCELGIKRIVPEHKLILIETVHKSQKICLVYEPNEKFYIPMTEKKFDKKFIKTGKKVLLQETDFINMKQELVEVTSKNQTTKK